MITEIHRGGHVGVYHDSGGKVRNRKGAESGLSNYMIVHMAAFVI